MRDVVFIAWPELVEPRAKAPEGLRPLGEGKSPFVDELAVEAVHEESLATGLNGPNLRGVAALEAILHAKDEPLDPGKNFREVS